MAVGARSKSPALLTIAAGALSVLGLVAANYLVARRTERKNAAPGEFVTVDGVRLHYTAQGAGSPVVLIHGNAVMGNDWDISGVTELLSENHRVISFDRPGCGHSTRPRGKLWTAAQQGDLLHHALTKLGVEQSVLVGHSWGTVVALSMAQRHRQSVAGLALISGYYFWSPRLDALLVAGGAVPGLGDLLRYTISPLLGWVQMPALKRAMFSPAQIPARFERGYSTAMVLRPSQIRATCVDGATMIPSVVALQSRYMSMNIPVAIIAGEGDKIVFKRGAQRLHKLIKGSKLEVVENAGHMVHHVASSLVANAVFRITQADADMSATATESANAIGNSAGRRSDRMGYKVTITSTDGQRHVYTCGGATDQEAMIYAGKVVEEKADAADPDATVDITRDGEKIGPFATVRDMVTRAI